MSDEGEAPRSYQPGGALRDERAFYIERAVDRSLYERLRAGGDACVVSARQVGKTSLVQRLERRLVEAGALCVYDDLDAIGTARDEAQWLYTLAKRLARRARVNDPSLPPFDPAAAIRAEGDITPWERFRVAFEQGLLLGHTRRVVIILDEIGATLRLDKAVREALFSFLRAMRADPGAARRVSVCLVGVVRPSEVVDSLSEGFFATATEVRVDDFTRAECEGFAPGLVGITDDPGALLDAVYAWTGGHPAFTQKVLHHAVLEGASAEPFDVRVERIVRKEILGESGAEDPVLTDARNRFQPRPGELWATLETWTAVRPRALTLYRQVAVAREEAKEANEHARRGELKGGASLQGGNVPEVEAGSDSVRDRVVQALRVTGLVSERYERDRVFLRRRNRIFATVFDSGWVDSLLADRPYTADVKSWEETGRSPDRVLRGADLREALLWREGRSDLSDGERALFDASVRIDNEENARDLELLRAKQNRTLFRVSAVFTLVSIVGVLVTALAFRKARLAEQDARREKSRVDAQMRQTGEALARERLATLRSNAREAVAIAATPGGGERAYALAVLAAAAREAQRDPETRQRIIEQIALVPSRRHPLLRTARAHEGGGAAVAFSPDGARVLSAGNDRAARVWDARSGARLADLTGHQREVREASFSADGGRVVTAGWDFRARLWDGHTGALVRELRDAGALTASFAGDGARVVTAGARAAEVWDGRTGAPIATLAETESAPEATLTAAAISTDGQRVVTGLSQGAVRLWDVASRVATSDPGPTPVAGRDVAVTTLAFSRDGERVIGGWTNGLVMVWDARAQRRLRSLRGHAGRVTAASFSPDGSLCLTAGEDRTARVWSVRTGAQLQVLRGHTDHVLAAAFSPDGRRAITAGDRAAIVWDVRSGAQVQTLQGHVKKVTAAVFSPDGERAATTGLDGTVRVWDVRGGTGVSTLQAHTGAVLGAAFSPDGARVVTASSDFTARVWDASAGLLDVTLAGHTQPAVAAAFSRDGRWVVTASDDGSARTWDAASGAAGAVLQAQGVKAHRVTFSADGAHVVVASVDDGAAVWRVEGWASDRAVALHCDVTDAAFSPDLRHVALAAADNTAALWNVHSGELTRLEGHVGPLASVAFSGDGSSLVTASLDGTARVWSTGEPRRVVVLSGHTGAVNGAALSPDGRRVVTAGADGTARLWNAAGGGALHVLAGHTDPLVDVGFYHDGERVVTASEDGSARVWDARDGTLLAALEGHANALTAVAVSPDDRLVVTTSRDGTARVWNVEVTRDPLGYFCRELAWMSPRAGAATEALEAPEVLEARGLCHVRRPRP